MRISHNSAIRLESIVRRVHSCERGGMGGYIDADYFESEPFDAALIALAPLWKRISFHEIEEFLYKWDHSFHAENEDKVDVNQYIQELGEIIDHLLRD